MTRITEIGRVENTAYGVSFVVCSNAEVVRHMFDCDDDDQARAITDAAGRAISDAGCDYERCSDFLAYNGGPRTGLVDAIVYVADVDDDGERFGKWRATWQRGAGATAIPAEIQAKIDAVIDAAYSAAK